jgi:hypothetical protein
MDPRKQMEAASAARKEDEAAARERYLEQSRRRLQTIIEKKVRTTFIGDLSRFEEHVGRRLWGHGKSDADLTKDELAWKKVWERLRADILTNGNNQIRALNAELEQYVIEWTRYQNVLAVKNSEEL